MPGVYQRTEKHIAASRRSGHKGGSVARDRKAGIHKLTHQQLSVIGTRGGKVGGPIQGERNASNGWMQHIRLIHYEKSHEDCEYCINQKTSAV